MTSNFAESADCLRSQGWRQGCLITPQESDKIIAASIDFKPQLQSAQIWLAVLTQDCDLVRDDNVEPYVEILAFQQLSAPPNNPMRGQSARTLHLQIEMAGQALWLEGCIHDRFRIKKKTLCDSDCAATLNFAENELRLLRQWLARRYTRAAFPDHFETHLAATKDPVKKLFKSAGAKLISMIYIAIENEDADANEDYLVNVILAVLAEDYVDDLKRQAIDEFEEKFQTIFNNRPHINCQDIRTMPEEDITLHILRRYKRFDIDYRSSDDDAAAPPEGVDIN
jgi:hypothetical protein